MTRRYEPVTFSPQNQQLDARIARQGEALVELLELELPPSRERSLALTWLDMAVMWSRRAVREKQLTVGNNE